MTFRTTSIRRSAAVLAVVGLTAGAALALSAGTNTPTAHTVSPVETELHAHNAVDTSDDRRLVGFADNVFLGQVLARTGQTAELSVPETQFSVEVLDSVKGSLVGTVTVNQFGGSKDGRTVLMEGDELLQPGQTYLFATRTRSEKGWETVVATDGKIKVRDNEHRQQLRGRFAAATEREIKFKPGD